MAYRKVNDDSLAAVAAAIRAKGGTSEPLAFPDGFISAISAIQAGGGDDSLPAENVSFSAEKIEPDRMYKSGWNWYADLVSITQEMVGTSKNLTPAQIVAELRRVIFVPQGKADDELLAIGILESAASAHNPVVAYGQAATKLDILAEPSVTAREVFA